MDEPEWIVCREEDECPSSDYGFSNSDCFAEATLALALFEAEMSHHEMEPISLSEPDEPEEVKPATMLVLPGRWLMKRINEPIPYKSVCLSTVCLGFFVSMLLVGIALTNHAPSVPFVENRSPNEGWSWTLVDTDTDVRLLHFENQQLAPGVTVVQGWKDGAHDYTVWLDHSKRSISLLDVSNRDLPQRCYEIQGQTMDVKAGAGYHLETSVAEIFQQPFPVNLPSSLFLPPNPNNPDTVPESCVLEWWPVEDHATESRAWEDLSGSSHFAVPTEDDSYAAALQTTQILGRQPSFDYPAFEAFLRSEKFDLVDTDFETSTDVPDVFEWPFKGSEYSRPFVSCKQLAQQLGETHPITQACHRLHQCTNQTSLELPQGALNYTEQCVFAADAPPCECLNDLASSIMVASVNKCGLCVNNSTACQCWARARLVSLAAQYSPCRHLVEVEDHSPYVADADRLSYLCSFQQVCHEQMTTLCTDAAQMCKLRVQGPVFHCFSSTYDYLLHFGLPPTVA